MRGDWHMLWFFNFICICPAPFMLQPIPHVACLNAFMVCFKKHLISFNSLITWAKIAHSVSLFVAHSWRYGMREYIYAAFSREHLCDTLKITFDIWSVLLVSYWHMTSLWSKLHDIPYLQEVKYIKLKFTNHPCFLLTDSQEALYSIYSWGRVFQYEFWAYFSLFVHCYHLVDIIDSITE